MTDLLTGLRLPCTFQTLALAALTLTFTSVSPARSDDAVQGSPLPPPVAMPESVLDQINQSAQGLAGKTSGGSWESTSEWKDYEKTLDGRWSYLAHIRLNAMRTWTGSALGDLRGKTSTVFYPFSGPDALYVDTLFPDSKILLMAGLEPVGTIPDLAKIQKDGNLGPYLTGVQTSLFTILAASFFKTKDMKTDFSNQLVDGLMPDIAVFLARNGYDIGSLQYVSLGSDGVVHAHEKSGATGVQITYFKGDRDDMQVLFYFQADLGNDGLHSNPGFTKLMHRLGPGNTYLKAASYLLYDDYFSSIRDAILAESVGVVEDDSGIPLHFFKPSEWDVSVYGNYTGPIAIFKDKYQPDLTQYYAANPHPPLTFGSGYKFVAANSSLLVAKKK
jgi:hypothetical protein